MTKAILASVALTAGILVGASGVCSEDERRAVPRWTTPALAPAHSTAAGASAALTVVATDSQ